jgi:hypothetical protein
MTTTRASLQLIENNNMHAPTIIMMEDAIDTIACDTNIFMESTSAVKLVSNLDGLLAST